jgi:hypothetical protein
MTGLELTSATESRRDSRRPRSHLPYGVLRSSSPLEPWVLCNSTRPIRADARVVILCMNSSSSLESFVICKADTCRRNKGTTPIDNIPILAHLRSIGSCASSVSFENSRIYPFGAVEAGSDGDAPNERERQRRRRIDQREEESG